MVPAYLAKLVYNSKKLYFAVDISVLTMVYKPTNIPGGGHHLVSMDMSLKIMGISGKMIIIYYNSISSWDST